MDERVCACGGMFPVSPNERNPRKWCSESCRVRGYRQGPPERECSVCGIKIAAGVHGNRKMCSKECKDAARFERRTPGASLFTCGHCGATELRKKLRGTAPKRCRSCGSNPRSRNPDEYRRLEHERRARRYGALAERIDHRSVFERDGWVCQICHQPVGSELSYPDPMSASLDHVVPLARGGVHMKSNVQLAHLRCNLSKGASVSFDQLALV